MIDYKGQYINREKERGGHRGGEGGGAREEGRGRKRGKPNTHAKKDTLNKCSKTKERKRKQFTFTTPS